VVGGGEAFWVGLFGRRSRNLGAGRDLENVSLRISKGWGKWDLVFVSAVMRFVRNRGGEGLGLGEAGVG
jgi:hypothetical protein